MLFPFETQWQDDFVSVMDRWVDYGVDAAVCPNLWEDCVLATLAQPWGGTQARDFSGRGNHGTLTGGPTWEYGAYRGGAFRAVSFDGTDDYVNHSGLSSTLQSLSLGTISWWARAEDITKFQRFFAASDESDASSDVIIYTLLTTGYVEIRVRENTANSIVAQYETNVVDGAWRHYAFRVNAAGNSLYVNGRAVTLAYTTGNAATQAFFSTVNGIDFFGIGIGKDSAGLEFPFKGGIGDFRIYSRDLSDTDIRQLAQHPLAAYETQIPQYFFVSSTTPTQTRGIPVFGANLWRYRQPRVRGLYRRG